MLASASQRRGAMVLLAILLAILAIRLLLNPRTIPEGNVDSPAPRLVDRLDPNTASAAELAAIPEMGEKRARAIVEYRERYRLTHPDRPAFLRISDLEDISGIGPGIVERMEPFLVFGSDKH